MCRGLPMDNEEMQKEKKQSKRKEKVNPIHEMFDIAEIFILSLSFVVIVFFLLMSQNRVQGSSMDTTLADGERLLLSNLFYTPERGDIVVFNDPSKPGIYSEPLVKRVIAVGGDTVEIKEGELFLNGEKLTEPYIKEPMTSSTNLPLQTVGEHSVFVMGDNRNASGDSRIFGQIDERCIIGKAFLRVYPFDRITVFDNPWK